MVCVELCTLEWAEWADRSVPLAISFDMKRPCPGDIDGRVTVLGRVAGFRVCLAELLKRQAGYRRKFQDDHLGGPIEFDTSNAAVEIIFRRHGAPL